MKHLFSSLLMLLVFLPSCNQLSNESSIVIDDQKLMTDLRIDPGMTQITADQAINVACLFAINQGIPETKSKNEISDVYTVTNDEGMPVFYAVNRAGNAGFTIVGASRKYFPILGYSDKGHFDEKYNDTGLSIWVNRQVVTVTAIEKGGVRDDSVDFNAHWRLYEKRSNNPFIKTKNEAEAFALRQESVAAWEAQGYTCYSLMSCPNDLPSATYEAWCSWAQGIANPDYDYLTYSVILEKRVDVESAIGPLMESSWEQDNGYNTAVPYYYSNGDHVDLGCTTVAIGQIMRYFKKPATHNGTAINWLSMPLNYATTTTANFLYNLGCDIGIAYSTGEVGASDYQVRNALQSYNYTVALDEYSYSTVKSNIQSGKPVYIGGSHYYPNGRQLGHAWVCEGYKYATFYYEYELKVLSVVPPLQYENLGSTQSSEILFTNYLYYNLGMGYGLNGWYYSGNTFSNLDGLFENQKMIYNITPPSK